MKILVAGLLAVLALAGAAPVSLDSQIVLRRYELEMGDLLTPKR